MKLINQRKRKNQKKLKQMMTEVLRTIYILFICISFMSGIYLFYTGFHNFDLGTNFKYLNAEYNLNLIDVYNIKGDTMTPNFMINLGANQIFIGFFLCLYCMIPLSFIFYEWISRRKK